MPRVFISLVAVLALLAVATPALAGGWATVRLDEPPGDVPVGKPWQFGFTVLQHDITPNSDVTPIVRAINKETGQEVTATAVQEGAVGHFVAELTLPEAGEWKWEVRPEPFAETALQTLVAIDDAKLKTLRFPASINAGSCAKLGEVAFDVADVAPQSLSTKSAGWPIGVSRGMVETSLAEMAKGEHAISISDDDPKATAPLVCGDVLGTPNGDELLIGLQPLHNSGAAGIAVLQDKGDQTAVTLYLMAIESGSKEMSKTETIEMLDNWIFSPVKLEATVGTTVTWVNQSSVVHQVTGEDLAFEDSGLIEPGGSFSMTFEKPGAYRFHCSPHPGMEGMVIVS